MTAGLLLAFLAYLLVYAGVKGVHPWAPIVEAFGGKAPPPPGTKSKGPESEAQAGIGTTLQGPPSAGQGDLTSAASRAKEAIERQYPDLSYEGGWSCRKIIPHDGGTSNTWSEHAWANAIDFTGSAVMMRKLLVWANLPHNRLRFKINNVIGPGSAVNAVHIDFFPSHSGQVPPCAGGPA